MKIKRILLLLVFFPFAANANGHDDFGLWYEAGVDKALGKGWSIGGSVMVRTFRDASVINHAFIELRSGYRVNKFLGFALLYRGGNYLDRNSFYHYRHRLFADVKGYQTEGNFEFSLRLRMQYTSMTYIEYPDDKRNLYDGRVKLKSQYNIPQSPIDLYASFETFSSLFRHEENLIWKSRTTTGLDFRISDRHMLSADYTYDRVNGPNHLVIHIIAVIYKFRL